MEKQLFSGVVTQRGANHPFKGFEVNDITIETDQNEQIVIKNVRNFPRTIFENKHILLFLVRKHSHMWTVMACKNDSGSQHLDGMLDTQWQNDYRLYLNDCIIGLVLGIFIITIPFITIPKLEAVLMYKKRRKEFIEIANNFGFNIKDIEYRQI